MSKTYRIVVDGVEHIVEVEDYNGNNSKVSQKTKEASSNENNVLDTKTTAPKTQVTENSIVSPLQGNLQDIKVSIGQTVKSGDVLVVIEAMKMENEVVAPKNGKVVAIHCQKGSKVNTGDALIDIA